MSHREIPQVPLDFTPTTPEHGVGLQRGVLPRIAAAAIRHPRGVFSLPKPGRHHHIIAMMTDLDVSPKGCEQGFLTDEGEFVDRKTAARIATEAGQIPRPDGPRPCAPGGRLYSEDVW